MTVQLQNNVDYKTASTPWWDPMAMLEVSINGKSYVHCTNCLKVGRSRGTGVSKPRVNRTKSLTANNHDL